MMSLHAERSVMLHRGETQFKVGNSGSDNPVRGLSQERDGSDVDQVLEKSRSSGDVFLKFV
jgi:hypothetical protein